jgi:TIR domain
MPYSVFVSHGWHDRWIARQIALNIRNQAGAEVFIDIFGIKGGDRIEEKVHAGLVGCNELISLLTPWSVDRNWV